MQGSTLDRWMPQYDLIRDLKFLFYYILNGKKTKETYSFFFLLATPSKRNVLQDVWHGLPIASSENRILAIKSADSGKGY